MPSDDKLAHRRKSKSPEERFWNFVEKTDTCWLWKGSLNAGGYGRFGQGPDFPKGQRTVIASRFSWKLHRGPIPPGLFVLHDCPGGDRPACVNPDHLWLGTPADNLRDAKEKGRMPKGKTHWSQRDPEKRARGERHGQAKLTEEQATGVISRLASGETARSVAHALGIAPASVADIKSGRNWSHLSRPASLAVHGNASLAPDAVRDIRRRYAAGGITQGALAAEYHVSKPLVNMIIKRHVWKDLE
jgi:hypothetical protein